MFSICSLILNIFGLIVNNPIVTWTMHVHSINGMASHIDLKTQDVPSCLRRRHALRVHESLNLIALFHDPDPSSRLVFVNVFV